jgi:hypothetical protein
MTAYVPTLRAGDGDCEGLVVGDGDEVGLGEGDGGALVVGLGVGVVVAAVLTVQVAVAVFGPFMRMAFEGEVVPEASPLQPVKVAVLPLPTGTVVGVTVTYAELPELYQPAPPAVP